MQLQLALSNNNLCKKSKAGFLAECEGLAYLTATYANQPRHI